MHFGQIEILISYKIGRGTTDHTILLL